MAAEKKRDLGIDILCCVGALMLLTLQYLGAIGFMEEPVTSWATALPVAGRWFSLSGAALLSAGTGYVLSTKKFSAGYFQILFRLVYVYLVCSLLALAMRVLLFGDTLTWAQIAQTILNFSPTETGRFAGMYFALLIAAPYLNAAFHGLKSRKPQLSLLLLLSLTAGLQPMLFAQETYLLPSWCKGLFPAAAYIGGAYIRKYVKKRRPELLLPLLFVLLAETVTVMLVSLPTGVLYCPWIDSLAALPSIGIALLLLALCHSREMGAGSVHRFFAGAAGGVLGALLLGDLIIDASLPAVVERFPSVGAQIIAGIVVVPVIFILSTVLTLLLQMPLFGVRAYLRSEDAEEEFEEPEPPKRSKKNPDVIVPKRTHTEPTKEKRSTALHTISVPVSDPETTVRLTQPKMEEPQGVHETHLPELKAPEPERIPDVPEEDDAEMRVYVPKGKAVQESAEDVKVYVPKHTAQPVKPKSKSGLKPLKLSDAVASAAAAAAKYDRVTVDDILRDTSKQKNDSAVSDLLDRLSE